MHPEAKPAQVAREGEALPPPRREQQRACCRVQNICRKLGQSGRIAAGAPHILEARPPRPVRRGVADSQQPGRMQAARQHFGRVAARSQDRLEPAWQFSRQPGCHQKWRHDRAQPERAELGGGFGCAGFGPRN